MIVGEYCKNCILEKKLKAIPATATPAQAEVYRSRVHGAVLGSGTSASPELHSAVSAIYRDVFGPERDYTEIKRRLNALMLGLEPGIQAAVDAAEDAVARAVQYAMVGNFIDFAALGDVDEGELRRRLEAVDAMRVDAAVLAALRKDARSARRLVLFTDNCGEIVTDKVLLRTLRRLNPALRVTVVARGMPVVNDATVEDAVQVGMGETADRVIGNGCDLPGTVLARISGEALAEADAADLLIAKGQGNYEGLAGCGRNVYYIFMCKCSLFVRRFGVEPFSGVLTREQDVTKYEGTEGL